ncbi:MAG: DUF3137 domain-containing protein [Mycobacteriales bacterium]
MTAAPMFVLVALLGVAVIGLIAYLSYQQAKKRRALLVAFASGQGWSLVERDDRWAEHFTGEPFDDGDSKQARNILQGSFRERAMLAFDYSYETHSTDSKGNRSTSTHRYSVAVLQLPGWLPTVEVVPEGVFGRLGTALGMPDLELESEDFNRAYRVRAENPKIAYDVLSPRTMELLVSRRGQRLRLSGTDAVCWESGSYTPSDLLARLDTLHRLLDGIPPFVWSDLKGSP